MIEWIAVGVILAFVGVIVVTSIDRSGKKTEAHDQVPMPMTQCKDGLITKDIKEQMDAVEKKVFSKAEEVKKIADHETEIITLGQQPSEEILLPPSSSGRPNPLEDTAQFQSISKKVEKVKKLSEG